MQNGATGPVNPTGARVGRRSACLDKGADPAFCTVPQEEIGSKGGMRGQEWGAGTSPPQGGGEPRLAAEAFAAALAYRFPLDAHRRADVVVDDFVVETKK